MTIILRVARLKKRVWWQFALFLGLAMAAGTASAALPSITSQPQSRTNTCGVTATFSLAATGDAPLTYQWRFNGANLSGATGTSLT